MLMTQEDYVEYSRHGTVLKGQEKAKVKSRFEEDVYINNHTVGNYLNELFFISTLSLIILLFVWSLTSQ